jgi:hypothetical protein
VGKINFATLFVFQTLLAAVFLITPVLLPRNPIMLPEKGLKGDHNDGLINT